MRTAVLLLTYGSPSGPDDVGTYLQKVYAGRAPDADVVDEMRRRYDVIGGSPLIARTIDQAAALEVELRRRLPDRADISVAAAFRFSEPSIDVVAREVGATADHIIGIVLSPQWAEPMMGGYVTALRSAVADLPRSVPTQLVADWYRAPGFLGALAANLRVALTEAEGRLGRRPPVLLTAHSMPRRIADGEPGYVGALVRTAEEVAAATELGTSWRMCYQSAGHAREPWLTPDLGEVVQELAAAGETDVVLSTVQFLSDHLELLYDIDVAAAEQARELGVHLRRAPALNAHPLLIDVFADLVERALEGGADSTAAGVPGMGTVRLVRG